MLKKDKYVTKRQHKIIESLRAGEEAATLTEDEDEEAVNEGAADGIDA